jgi:hypothetical protein
LRQRWIPTDKALDVTVTKLAAGKGFCNSLARADENCAIQTDPKNDTNMRQIGDDIT